MSVAISGLSAATTLAGTEVAPCVQGGVTKKFTPSQVRDYIITAGNIPSTSLASGAIVVSNTLSLSNAEASAAIVKCAPVYISAAGSMKRAKADAAGTSQVVALASDTSTAAAASGLVLLNNSVLTATTAQWDAVTGQSGGLTAASTYYLDPANAGKLTTTVPSTVGQSIVIVGQALSTTQMLLTIGQPVLL